MAMDDSRLTTSDAEIFDDDESDERTLTNWIMNTGLKGLAGLFLAIGLLPYVLWYRDTGTLLIYFGSSLLFIWTGIVLWAFWYYFKRKYAQDSSM
ncbi:MAG: hypothetical protein ACW98Y_19000 [Candidatus Thorarchaeota archaeon]